MAVAKKIKSKFAAFAFTALSHALSVTRSARGQPGQPFSHKTGHGYVKAHRGFHDAIFVKRNNFNLLLHETFGGGFSPTAVLKLRRLARKVARGSVDRTAPTRPSTRSLTLLCPTMQRASLSLSCEAAQLENGGGREAAAERLVKQQVEVVALDKDRVVVETAMRLDVAVAGLVGEGLARLPARLSAHV